MEDVVDAETVKSISYDLGSPRSGVAIDDYMTSEDIAFVESLCRSSSNSSSCPNSRRRTSEVELPSNLVQTEAALVDGLQRSFENQPLQSAPEIAIVSEAIEKSEPNLTAKDAETYLEKTVKEGHHSATFNRERHISSPATVRSIPEEATLVRQESIMHRDGSEAYKQRPSPTYGAQQLGKRRCESSETEAPGTQADYSEEGKQPHEVTMVSEECRTSSPGPQLRSDCFDESGEPSSQEKLEAVGAPNERRLSGDAMNEAQQDVVVRRNSVSGAEMHTGRPGGGDRGVVTKSFFDEPTTSTSSSSPLRAEGLSSSIRTKRARCKTVASTKKWVENKSPPPTRAVLRRRSLQKSQNRSIRMFRRIMTFRGIGGSTVEAPKKVVISKSTVFSNWEMGNDTELSSWPTEQSIEAPKTGCFPHLMRFFSKKKR